MMSGAGTITLDTGAQWQGDITIEGEWVHLDPRDEAAKADLAWEADPEPVKAALRERLLLARIVSFPARRVSHIDWHYVSHGVGARNPSIIDPDDPFDGEPDAEFAAYEGEEE